MKQLEGTMKDLVKTKQTSSVKHMFQEQFLGFAANASKYTWRKKGYC